MKLKCQINGVEYDLVQGLVFAEEYNETLDSGTIIIDQIPQIKDLKPYDDVYIYDGTFVGYNPEQTTRTIELHAKVYNDLPNRQITFTINKTLTDNLPETYNLRLGITLSNVEVLGEIQVYANYEYRYLTSALYLTTTNTAFVNQLETLLGINLSDLIFTLSDNVWTCNLTYDASYAEAISIATFEWVKSTMEINITDKVTLPSFYRHLLVDQFSEERLNLVEDLYKYKIELFSETKKLEAVQLPNISITQPLDFTKKISVYDYLVRFVDMYSPKEKIATDTTLRTYGFFNKYTIDPSLKDIYGSVYSPDFSLNNPTLKDVLTQLMLVKDRIPYVKDDVIYGLDITERKSAFNVDTSKINYITGSRSSSNHCDNLRRTYNNALSQEKSCRMVEYLGFRNVDETLLTLDNMRVETRYPIYKINKVYLCYYKRGTLNVPASVTQTTNKYISFAGTYGFSIGGIKGTITNVTTSRTDTLANATLTHVNSANTSGENSIGFTLTSATEVSGTITVTYEFQPFNYSKNGEERYFLCKQDITKLVKLNNERNLLSQDYQEFRNDTPTNIDEMAQYKLCTVGYDIGGNSITGWGTKYTYPIAWWDVNVTYIENILTFMNTFNPYGIYQYGYLTKAIGGLEEFESLLLGDNVYNPFSNDALQYKALFFEIDYDAFYNGAVVHSKDGARDDITINDNSSSSLTLLELDGLFQKEKVNRFGNKAIQINARYDDISELQELGSVFEDDVIIYHREYAIYDNYVACTYYGTKDYVLKNYFTSVYAKHRTYNLMSYSDSVNRAENKKRLILLSKDKCYYENENIAFNFSSFLNNDFLSEFFSWFKQTQLLSIDNIDYQSKVNYGIIRQQSALDTIDNYFLSDVNEFVSGNSLCFNMRMFDNVSGGVYIKNKEPENDPETDSQYKGSVQEWYISVDDTDTGFARYMGFEVAHIDTTDIFSDNNLISSTTDLSNIYDNVLFKLPKIDLSNTTLTNSINGVYEINKDNKEVIDMTFQIEPISQDDDIMFSSLMVELSDLVGTKSKFNVDTPVEDNDSYDESFEFICSSIQQHSSYSIYIDQYTTQIFDIFEYFPLMIIKIPLEKFDNFVKPIIYECTAEWNSLSNKKEPILPFNLDVSQDKLVSYRFEANAIRLVDDNTIELIGTETATIERGTFINSELTSVKQDRTIYLTRTTTICGEVMTDNYVYFVNCNLDLSRSSNVFWANSNNQVSFTFEGTEYEVDRYFVSERNSHYLNGEEKTLSEDTASYKNLLINVNNATQTKTYQKNLFAVYSSDKLKKTIVYDEYEHGHFNTLYRVDEVISKIKDENGRDCLNIYIGNAPTTAQSLAFYYEDNVDYYKDSDGLWQADFSKASLKFVFGVNISEEDKTNGYIRIYLSTLSSRDERVYDTYHNLIGTIYNYAEDTEKVYGDNQYYNDIIKSEG